MNKNLHGLIILFCLTFIFQLPSFGECDCTAAGFNIKNEKVALSKETIETVKLKTQKVEEKTIFEAINTTGQVEEIPKNHFDVNTPVQGTVAQVLVDLGDKVSTGQAVAIIESPEVAKLEAEVKQLEAELELAQNNFEREKALFEKGIAAKKDFEATKTVLKSIEAKLSAAKSNLKIFTGLSDSSEGGSFSIKVRKSGTIIERNITVGQVVNSNQILFQGVDLSTLWASADIYEKDISKVTKGQVVYISLDGNPSNTFQGNLTYIGSVINEKSRTLPVKATLNNSKGLLNPGAFVHLSIHTNQKKQAISIPATAIIDMDEANNDEEKPVKEHTHIVYVKDKETFEPRKIEVVTHDSKTVEVLSGLMSGEEIVVEGTYQLQFAEGGLDEEGKENSKVVVRNKNNSVKSDDCKDEHCKDCSINPIYSNPLFWISSILGILIIIFIVIKLIFKRRHD